MALSVSGFPEPVRHSNEAFSSGDEGHGRNTNTPRLLGFFGGAPAATSNRKLDSARRVDFESDALPKGSPISAIFPSLEAQEFENEFKLDDSKTQNHSKRHALPVLPRRTTPSPVRGGGGSPMMTRLEIGAGTSRTVSHPKTNPPPTLVVEEWSSNESSPLVHGSSPESSSSSSSRVASSFKATAGPSRHVTAVPVKHSSPPNFPCAVAGPCKHPGSALSTASQASTPSPITSPSSKVLLTQSSRAHKPHSTSVSIRYQPFVEPAPSSPDAASRSNPNSNPTSPTTLAVPIPIRPLPSVAGLKPSIAGMLNTTSAAGLSSRRTPPSLKRPRTSPSAINGFNNSTSSAVNARNLFENIPSSWASRPVDLNSSRPSSPPIGAAGLSKTTTTTMTHHHRPPPLKMPRARSHSWTRRERSLDSYTRLNGGLSRTPPGSAGLTTSFMLNGSVSRNLTVGRMRSPSSPQMVSGVRPLIKKRTVAPAPTSGQQERRGSISTGPSTGDSGASVPSLSPSSTSPSSADSMMRRGSNPSERRMRPPSPSSGPSQRTTAIRSNKATLAITTPPPVRFHPTLSSKNSSHQSSNLLSIPLIVHTSNTTRDTESMSTESSPLHVHPIEIDHYSHRDSAESPIDSPLEFFVDGPETDVSSKNRSPSPIRYARPPSDGELSDWYNDMSTTNDEQTSDDEDGAGASSSTSNSIGVRKRRTLLRSYKMDYRPPEHHHHHQQQQRPLPGDLAKEKNHNFGSSSPPVASPTSQPTALPTTSKPPSKKKKKKDKWSFSDLTSMAASGSTSVPGTRSSSPERKGRSRQPRRLAEAVSLALGGGSRGVTASHSSSGRGSTAGLVQPPLLLSPSSLPALSSASLPGREFEEVLDIRSPSLEGKDERVEDRMRTGNSVLSEFRIDGSRRHSIAMAKRRQHAPGDSVGDYASGSSQSDVGWVTKEGKASGQNLRAVESRIIFSKSPDSDTDGDDNKSKGHFMWLSRDRPPMNPVSLIPRPPQRLLHRITDTQQHRVERVDENNHPVSSVVVIPSHSKKSPSTRVTTGSKHPSSDIGKKQRTANAPTYIRVNNGSSGNSSDIVILSPHKKEEDDDDDDDGVGKKQGTASAPTYIRVNSGSSGNSSDIVILSPHNKEEDDDDDDDVVLPFIMLNNPRVESKVEDNYLDVDGGGHTEVMVVESRRVMERGGSHNREAQVVDVIPKLRSLKSSR